jgi:hypothetical protein
MSKIWVLTRTHNDYDQHGHYFVEAFKKLPTLEQLGDATLEEPNLDLLHLRKGGGRVNKEDVWFNLNQIDLK